MLNIVRRGPASAATSIFSRSFSSKCVRVARPRDIQQGISRNAHLNAARSFSTSIHWRRSATAAAAEYEDEAIEAEIEPEVNAEEPSSDTKVKHVMNHGPVTKFQGLADRGMVCDTVIRTLTRDMGLETMTPVQSMTINETLKGIDVLAQAKTGTGKTIAFLLPVLQNIINVDPKLETRSRLGRIGSSTDIRAIIISPTRELAEQIAVEAKKVTRDTGVIVQTAVGGSQKSVGLRKIKMEGCHILVGTPGRLNDILSDPYSQVRAPKLSALVLDEADRLLDQGFAPEIKAIQDLLPDRREVDRQTLLFSATVPREVMQVVRHTMKPDFKFVRTVQEGEQQTHEKVPQKLVNVGGFENLMPALVELCKREINPTGEAGRPFKAIVYFSATAEVSLASAMLQNLRNPGQSIFHQHPLHPCTIIEMHAKLTQQQRTRAADSFRRATSSIMLSSDVTARGMDFPNVTHVIQVGLPPSEEQYVHRIGRTARGDKTGEGWMLVTSLEAREIRRRLPNMPLRVDSTLETSKVDMRKDAQLPECTAKILTQVGDAAKMVPRSLKAMAYMANLGVFQWVNNKEALIDALNDRAKYGWGMDQPPMVGHGLASKLGLSRVQGINIGSEGRSDFGDGGGRGGRSGRGGFGGGREKRAIGGDRSPAGRTRGVFDSERGGSSERSGRSSFEGGDREGGFGGRGGYSNDRNDHGGSSRGGFSGGYGRGSVGGFGGREGGREGRRESRFSR